MSFNTFCNISIAILSLLFFINIILSISERISFILIKDKSIFILPLNLRIKNPNK